MREFNESARIANKFVYILEAFFVVLLGFFMGKYDITISKMLSCYFAVTAVAIHYISKNESLSSTVRNSVYIAGFIILAVIARLTFNSDFVFVAILLLQGIMIAGFMNQKLAMINMIVTIIVAMTTEFFMIMLKSHTFSDAERIVGLVTLILLNWFWIIIIKNVEFQIKKNEQQEQSLDDFTKIIETKCDEARMATRSKSEFLSNMSHEIRTPINAVLGMNEMILRESTDKNILEYAANVESSGKMLLSLINDILDFSKIESGKMEIIPVEYQVSSVLNDLVNMIKPRADEKGLKLVLQINSAIPNNLKGDEVRIKQIVTNILTNAVKYTDKGTVTLIADFEKTGDSCCELYLAVKDTGRGIKPEDRAALFESFRRVDEKANRNIEGTGLGLSITKRFVDMMYGELGVESTYGEGSLFYAKIPQDVIRWEEMGDFKEQFEQSLKHKSKYHRSFTAKDARLLLVDDNAMNLAVAEGLLKNTLVQIDKASSGNECLEMLRNNSYDLILLDHMMPGMDGVETLKQIKAEKLAQNVPVIALTANAVSGAREMYIDYGFEDYLTKPIVGNALEKLIFRWLPKELIVDEKQEDDKADENLTMWPPQMDVETAMQYSMGGEEGIRFNITLYLDNVQTTKKNLETAFEAHSCADYAVYAHGLKSTSATIGLMELSGLAKELELAGKNGDFDTISEKHAAMMCMYEAVVAELQKIV